MLSTREVMETTIALEKATMGLYARFTRIFARDPELKEFWSTMARDEARHVGALELVATVLGLEGMLDRPSPISLDNSTIVRLRGVLEKYSEPAASRIEIGRALAAAVEIEETELEDLVGDLLKTMPEQEEYESYLRLLVHDLGDLSYMVERRTGDPDLLRRCDAIVNRHAEALRSAAGR